MLFIAQVPPQQWRFIDHVPPTVTEVREAVPKVRARWDQCLSSEAHGSGEWQAQVPETMRKLGPIGAAGLPKAKRAKLCTCPFG